MEITSKTPATAALAVLPASQTTILYLWIAEVDQQSYRDTGGVQIINQLSLMLWDNLRHRFEFDNHVFPTNKSA